MGAMDQFPQHLEKLRQISLALTSGQRDLASLMDVLTHQAMGLLECDGGGLWLWRDKEGMLELVFEIHAGEQDMRGRRLKPGEGMVGTAFAERRLLAIDDYAAWPGRAVTFDFVPFISAIAAPMIWQDQVFGVLTFTRSYKQPFSDQEQFLADFLASQAAAAIQNVHLFEEMQRAFRRADALYRAGRTLIEMENIEHALLAAARGAAEGIGADMCFINVINVEQNELEYVVAGGPRAPQTFDKAPLEELWQGLSGVALRTLQPVFSPKWMMPDPRESREAQERRARFGAGSIIIVPMQYRGKIMGTMSAVNMMDSPDFTEQDVDVMAAIANQATAAVMNARLFEQTRQTLAQSERRARQLVAAAEVARAISTILDLNELLPRVVEVIRERYDLYYVGLFLLDDARRWAVLRAGTGEAGQAMLAAGHKLQVGGESMIGACVARNEARIALDVEGEETRFKNPYLPRTRSEMALPLISRGQVIGAMTIQSDQLNAFSQEDITALQAMADQVAVAIDNARLFAESQNALQEMRALQQRYTGQAWTRYTERQTISGYEQTPGGISPLGKEMLPQTRQAIRAQSALVEQAGADNASRLVVPIVLRGQPIGALGLQAESGRVWSADEIALAQTLAEQLALAADNVRLLDETQRRAAQEKLIGEVTARMRETLNLDQILRTAALELGQVSGAIRVDVRLKTEGEQ